MLMFYEFVYLTLTRLIYDYRKVFSLFFLNRNLVLDEKDQNPKAQPSPFKIEALRIFWKIDIFGENP